MNNTRIRYQAVKPGVLQSRRRFITEGGQEVLVELDLNAKKYRVLDASTGAEVASGGNTRNSAVLKIQSKKGLMKLGVSFSDEKRERGGSNDVVG